MELASSSYSSEGVPRTTQGDEEGVQIHHFPAALLRRRSFKPRSVPHSQHSGLADSELIQPIQLMGNLKLDSDKKLKSKVDVEDKPQKTVDPKVMMITGPKLKSTVRVFGSGHRQASNFGRGLLRASSGVRRCFFFERQVMNWSTALMRISDRNWQVRCGLD